MQTLTFSVSLHDIPSKKGIHEILVICFKKKHETVHFDAYFIPELRVKFLFSFFSCKAQWPISQLLTEAD